MAKIPSYEVKQVYFEDINAGDSLTSIIHLPFTQTRGALFGAAFGGFCPGHWDYRFCKEQNHETPYSYGVQHMVWMSQIMTDWMGPNSFLKKLNTMIVAVSHIGDQITTKGKVVKKYSEDNENLVECEIWQENQNGQRVAEATAVAAVPEKSSLGKK